MKATDYSGPRLIEAANTRAAPWWRWLLIYLFARRVHQYDGRFFVTIAIWRGQCYLLDFDARMESKG